MSRAAANFRQSDIERAIRAARKAGLAEIEIKVGDKASIRMG